MLMTLACQLGLDARRTNLIVVGFETGEEIDLAK
jgi:hypothetical protein